MKFSQAQLGRVFVIRLEDGEVLHETVERFAKDHSISAAVLVVLGGAGGGSVLVVGPEDGKAHPVRPMERVLGDVHEVAGAGTVFPDENGTPVLHMHVAGGRGDATVTGCVRKGVRAWNVLEVVLLELTGTGAARVFDPAVGFAMLVP